MISPGSKTLKLLNHGIGGGAGLDHDDGGARTLQGSGEFLHGLGGDENAFDAMLRDQLFRAGVVTIEQCHGIAMVGKVASQIAAHCSETDNADVGLCCHGLYPFAFGINERRIWIEPISLASVGAMLLGIALPEFGWIPVVCHAHRTEEAQGCQAAIAEA